MSKNTSGAVASNAELGLSDDDVARLLPRLKHRPGMIGYECYSFGDVAHAVRAAVAAERELRMHPLRRLGARLASLLDEDQWAECEALLLEAGVKPNSN